ncbi:hypothetical protein CRYUN_Cryun21dG0079400 [Craigia yunnanensis]
MRFGLLVLPFFLLTLMNVPPLAFGLPISTKRYLWSSLKAVGLAQGEDAIKAAVTQVEEVLVRLEEALGKCSKGKPFFGGDQLGYLDIAFGGYLPWLRFGEKMIGFNLFSEVKTPALLDCADRFCSDSSVKDLMPGTEKLQEFAKMKIAIMTGPAPPKWLME